MFVPLVEVALAAYHIFSSCCRCFSMVDHSWGDHLFVSLAHDALATTFIGLFHGGLMPCS
jgi:hypothetical protein